MSYQEAKEKYARLGIDTDAAIARLKTVPVALHCWQGDDVGGFDQKEKTLTGGIQTTGNYPGKATTPEELMADIDEVIRPGEDESARQLRHFRRGKRRLGGPGQDRPQAFQALGGLLQGAGHGLRL